MFCCEFDQSFQEGIQFALGNPLFNFYGYDDINAGLVPAYDIMLKCYD